MRIASSLRRRLNNTGRFFLNIPLMLIILVPLLYTISISVMPPDEIYGNHLIPTSVKFTNYINSPVHNFRMILNLSLSQRRYARQMVTCSLAHSPSLSDSRKSSSLGVLAP